MKDIPAKFAIIDDPRHSGYITHKLEHILTIVVCAVLWDVDYLSLDFVGDCQPKFRQMLDE